MKVALIGSPNVGKSLIFYHLTGKYVMVSNYPGTSLDVMKGKIKGLNATLIDTPGLYSFTTITEEERIAKRMLLEEKPDVVVHVVDAKNIERMLPLTLQLIDANFNPILVLNAMDEAESLGLKINVELLKKRLGIPVIATIATQRKGMGELKNAIAISQRKGDSMLKFSPLVENYLAELASLLSFQYPINKKFLSLLLLMEDKEAFDMIKHERKSKEIRELVEKARKRYPHALAYEISMQIQKIASKILEGVVEQEIPKKGSITEKLSTLSLHPLFSIPMAIASLALLYLFAGVLGAQILVGFLESIFEEYINSPLNKFLDDYMPYYWLRELIGGEFGMVTLGLRYAIAIILPIVGTFFFIFSIIEDSGYLPRLAMLLDRALKPIGLGGKAVIPLVLGLGCGTMATIVTRVLETRREKILATLILAVGIPCSTQLGVTMSIAPSFGALLIWFMVVSGVTLSISLLASKLIHDSIPFFFMEVPPLRIPNIENVVTKTATRLEWYFKEVLPIFILASIFIWAGRITGLFDVAISAIAFPSVLIGLPEEAAIIFLFGFFRRDYGAAGLFDLASRGLLNYPQIIVAMVTLTLFAPCIAQFLVMLKERGLKIGIIIFATAIALAFGIGYLTHATLGITGV